jgi:hypothetical protein
VTAPLHTRPPEQRLWWCLGCSRYLDAKWTAILKVDDPGRARCCRRCFDLGGGRVSRVRDVTTPERQAVYMLGGLDAVIAMGPP